MSDFIQKDPRETEEKKKKQDDLDTETTFADMNVDGFSWYDPSRKKGEKREKIKLTKAEKRAMYKAAFTALVPYLLGATGVFLVLYLLMRLWLL